MSGAVIVAANVLLLFLMLRSLRPQRGRSGGGNDAPPVQEQRPEGSTRGAYDASITATLEAMLRRAVEDERKAAAIVERSEHMNSFGGVVIGDKTLKRQKNELYMAQRKRLAIETRLRRELANQSGER